MHKFLVAGAIIAVLVIGVVLLAQRLNEQGVEGAARTAFFLDCRNTVIRTFARSGQETDADLIEGLCPTTLFDANKDAILACYRADSSTDGFRQCLSDKGIRNPP